MSRALVEMEPTSGPRTSERARSTARLHRPRSRTRLRPIVGGTALAVAVLLFRRSTAPEAVELPYPLLVDLVPGALLVLDNRRMVRFATRGVGPLLGYEVSEVVGRPVGGLFTADSRAAVIGLVASVVESGRRQLRELPAKSRLGVTVPVEVTIERWRDSKDGAMAVYLRNLTERDALTEAVARRAAELSRSNRDLEQFAYVASHDLQEPLRMVGSYTQLLGEKYRGKLDADAEEYLRFTHDGVVRMRQLIDDLLAFARVGTRGKPFELVPTGESVDQAVGNLEGAIRAKQAEVTHGSLPTVDGDRSQLVQLFQNLIGNGIKFHGSGTPHVRVDAERQGAEWMFSVQDDGIGIPPEYQEKVFLMFQRLHTREEYPGSGIGLAICKRVVERHGGRIGIESSGRPGRGTRFWFTIPVPSESAVGGEVPKTVPEEDPLAARARSLIEDRLRELI